MRKPIIMPQVGQDVETAIISEWKIKENDLVKKGDIIAVVDSDKASFEVEAFESGVVQKLLYEEGDEAKVFDPIAYLAEPGESQSEIPQTDNRPQQQALVEKDDRASMTTQSPKQPSGTTRLFVSPLARRVAREESIDLSELAGSGPDGRVIKRDVLAFLKTRESIPKQAPAQPETHVEDASAIPFSKMRAKIAERLANSKQTIPHFYLFLDVDLSLALAIRAAYNEKTDTKVSINDMVVACVAKALTKHPKLNSHVKSDSLVLRQKINIGVAVSVDGGLLVPVIPEANQKSLREISAITKAMVEQARDGVLSQQAVATFTVSNLGMYSIDSFLPIINPPEAAILGVGKVVKKVIPLENDAIGVRDMMTLRLVCDHRAVDGAEAAKFLNEVKKYLENFRM